VIGNLAGLVRATVVNKGTSSLRFQLTG